MKSKQPAQSKSASARENLTVRYGEIGISAVVAAMRFRGDTRTQPQAPSIVPRQSDVDLPDVHTAPLSLRYR